MEIVEARVLVGGMANQSSTRGRGAQEEGDDDEEEEVRAIEG